MLDRLPSLSLVKRGWKPYHLKEYNGKTVECISYPWPENGKLFINVRTTPDDPTTIFTIELKGDEL